MKKTNYIIGIIAALLFFFNSCSEWLDVNPRSEVKEELMFSSESGFKQALNGAYILIAQGSLYGKNVTMYIPETFARHWTIPVTVDNEMNRLADFDYTHSRVEPLIRDIWLSYYKVIVQLNDILEHLENSEVRFEYNNDKLIKGEALGLRAFLHFDLLRLFGPVPDASASSKIAIPYVRTKTKEPAQLLSLPYSTVIQRIEEDLNAAEQLLKDIDPIQQYTNNQLNSSGSNVVKDSWQLLRQVRFNYYACWGTKARFYQWTGNKLKAIEYAKKVIETVNNDGTSKFPLTKTTDITPLSPVNFIFFTEQLFGIHNPDLQKIVEPLFKDGARTILWQEELYMDACYEKAINPNDMRYKITTHPYWEPEIYPNQTINHFRKYTGNSRISSVNRVPLLRLAEMYLILIENLPLTEAAPYFSAFRIARSMDISTEASSMADEPSRMDRVEKEYRKDFFGEGQMFFFYKRHNYSVYTWPNTHILPANPYVVPRPKDQIKFE